MLRPVCLAMMENSGQVISMSRVTLARRHPAEINLAAGRLAQLVERLLYTQDVGGSNPSPPTNDFKGFASKLVRVAERKFPAG